jgi:predicted nucleotidyltransferase
VTEDMAYESPFPVSDCSGKNLRLYLTCVIIIFTDDVEEQGKSPMNKTEKIVLDRFKALLSKRVGLHSLIMFGSRARGDADLDSDLDVLVVLDSQPTDRGRDLISDCAWEAGFEYGSSSFLSSLPNESGKRVRNVIRSSAKPCRLKEFRYEAHVRHV